MSNRAASAVIDFFFTPQLTVRQTPARYLSYPLVLSLVFLATLSSSTAELLARQRHVTIPHLLAAALFQALLFLVLVYFFLSLVSFILSFRNRSFDARRVYFFALLSFTPSLFLVPLFFLLGKISFLWVITVLAMSLYELYLFLTTLHAVFGTSRLRILLLLIIPTWVPFLIILLGALSIVTMGVG